MVYAAQVEDSIIVDHVVAGIIVTFSIRARALFDNGALHSFISRGFALLHGLEIGPLSYARGV